MSSSSTSTSSLLSSANTQVMSTVLLTDEDIKAGEQLLLLALAASTSPINRQTAETTFSEPSPTTAVSLSSSSMPPPSNLGTSPFLVPLRTRGRYIRRLRKPKTSDINTAIQYQLPQPELTTSLTVAQNLDDYILQRVVPLIVQSLNQSHYEVEHETFIPMSVEDQDNFDVLKVHPSPTATTASETSMVNSLAMNCSPKLSIQNTDIKNDNSCHDSTQSCAANTLSKKQELAAYYKNLRHKRQQQRTITSISLDNILSENQRSRKSKNKCYEQIRKASQFDKLPSWIIPDANGQLCFVLPHIDDDVAVENIEIVIDTVPQLKKQKQSSCLIMQQDDGDIDLNVASDDDDVIHNLL